MKIVVDNDLCEANAVCVRYAPEVFELDASEKLHLKTEQPGEELREKVARAVARCPRGALKLVG